MSLALSTPSPRAIGFALPLLFAASLLSAADIRAADASAGQAVFSSHCAACHSTSPGVNKIGPSLAGIIGSRSGTVAGYAFSAGMKDANLTWDEATLDRFLQNPGALVHGTKMFYRVSNPTDRENVIAFLGTLKQ
jgi:cytochrome c